MHREFTDSGIYFLVTWLIEALRSQHLTYYCIGILVNHQGTKYSTLNIRSLRLHVSIGVVDGLLSPTTLSSTIICLFWHGYLLLWVAKISKKNESDAILALKILVVLLFFQNAIVCVTQQLVKTEMSMLLHEVSYQRYTRIVEHLSLRHVVHDPLYLSHVHVTLHLRFHPVC